MSLKNYFNNDLVEYTNKDKQQKKIKKTHKPINFMAY